LDAVGEPFAALAKRPVLQAPNKDVGESVTLVTFSGAAVCAGKDFRVKDIVADECVAADVDARGSCVKLSFDSHRCRLPLLGRDTH
jgi:hypothetical protein